MSPPGRPKEVAAAQHESRSVGADSPNRDPRRRRPRRPTDPVVDLARVRIERALHRRERYRYVRPRVEREGAGWKVVSPNCSRNIDPQGGEIAIAWLVQGEDGQWRLHARDHALDGWRLEAAGVTLEAALARMCEDPQRIFWP